MAEPGAALCMPLVPGPLTRAGLRACTGRLVLMYLRTHGLHKPRSCWPPAGSIQGKGVWMFGIGLSVLIRNHD